MNLLGSPKVICLINRHCVKMIKMGWEIVTFGNEGSHPSVWILLKSKKANGRRFSYLHESRVARMWSILEQVIDQVNNVR